MTKPHSHNVPSTCKGFEAIDECSDAAIDAADMQRNHLGQEEEEEIFCFRCGKIDSECKCFDSSAREIAPPQIPNGNDEGDAPRVAFKENEKVSE